jgi:thiol-disulfide isomerase/thioredoxin
VRNIFLLTIILVVFLILSVPSCQKEQAQTTEEFVQGQIKEFHNAQTTKVQSMTLSTLDGQDFPINFDENHNIFVIDFWATWCSPCIEALMHLEELQKWSSEKELPINVIAVNALEEGIYSEKTQKVNNFLVQNNVKTTFPIVLDLHDSMVNSLGIELLPTTLIVLSNGEIYSKHLGMSAYREGTLKEQLLKIIR